MKKWLQMIVVATSLLVVLPAAAQPATELYQVSVINALLQGVYDGDMSIKQLKQHGDFGIGTFNALDGEMVAVDGGFYQVKHTGQVVPAAEELQTPFATVVHFQADKRAELHGIENYEQLQLWLNPMLDNPNYFYAIRIDGLFSYVKTRSVPAQKRPYRPLAEVTKAQPTFELAQVRGTVLGFWCPQYVNGMNVPGYHLHFISEDRTQGGHVLALRLDDGIVQTAAIRNFSMQLPGLAEFQQAALDKDYHAELKAVEQ